MADNRDLLRDIDRSLRNITELLVYWHNKNTWLDMTYKKEKNLLSPNMKKYSIVDGKRKRKDWGVSDE